MERGGGGEESEYPEKNLSQGREQTRNSQPTYGIDARIELGPHTHTMINETRFASYSICHKFEKDVTYVPHQGSLIMILHFK